MDFGRVTERDGGDARDSVSCGHLPLLACIAIVAKMASYAIFQYNILAINDTHNTWTNMIVKITILRLLGSSDDKEKIGVARPEGPPLW